jgi:hypothetical protein
MQINDKVKFLNEALEGTITRIIDDKMVGVSVEDGFEIPVMRREIMLISKGNAVENHDKKTVPEAVALNTGGSEIAIGFEQSTQTWFRATLINNSQHDILLSVSVKQGKQYKSLFGGRVEKRNAYLFNTLDLAEIQNWGTYCFRIIFHENQADVPRAPWYLEYTFRSKDFTNPVIHDQKTTYLIPLKPNKVEQFSLAETTIKIETPDAPQVVNISRPEEVVDLHIQHLVKNIKALTADEAINVQMSHFNNLFEKAIALNYQKITFIHGVGNGTLKQRIWKAISGHPSVKTFYEARKEKFGYGATEIEFL